VCLLFQTRVARRLFPRSVPRGITRSLRNEPDSSIAQKFNNHRFPKPLLLFVALWSAMAASPLYERGYTVLPEPQKVTLEAGDFRFAPNWRLEIAPGIAPGDSAIAALKEDLAARFRVTLAPNGRAGVLRLAIQPNSVAIGAAQDRDRKAIAEQAYRVDLHPGRVEVTANAPTGLFYGVETLVQLLKPRDGALWLPEGRIEDWPDVELRQIYCDDAHHLDRPEALKKAIRQAAFFKLNGFVLKLEGHFQFKSAPALVEPYALTPAEYQALTDYGLKYHIQLIPYLDGPAHIAFILKHPEYAKLRAFPDSNYELCVTNPDSYKLLDGMYRDLMDANRGVKYFYLSTDEPYYVGMADNQQCQEAPQAKALGSVGKLLAQFTTKASGYLHDHGRTVIFWGEFPMKPDDIPSLPHYLVNGEVYGQAFDLAFKKQGIREMIYTSSQGGNARLFPDYFPLPAMARLHPETRGGSSLSNPFRKISFDTARRDADLMGEVNAGWADQGLHPETFWLGYAASASAGWHPGSPDLRQTASTFYTLYYGWTQTDMDRLYHLMSEEAQFWNDSWDPVDSTSRKGIWGYSNGIFHPRHPAHDQSIVLPPAPGADLAYRSDWAQTNAHRIELAAVFQQRNEELFGLLHENVKNVELNRYNLVVFLSIAGLYQQNLEFLHSLAAIDRDLQSASKAAAANQSRQAVQAADRALDQAREMLFARNRAFRDAQEAWYQTWYPRVAEANGRTFLHDLDDVKDHLPDRTVDMTYLILRQLQLPVNAWISRIRDARNRYAADHQLPARTGQFDWLDLQPVSGLINGRISLE
jgi:hexosaminidase